MNNAYTNVNTDDNTPYTGSEARIPKQAGIVAHPAPADTGPSSAACGPAQSVVQHRWMLGAGATGLKLETPEYLGSQRPS